jgi:hypothetical protein
MTWTSDYGTQRACQEDVSAWGLKGLKPVYYSVVFSRIQGLSNTKERNHCHQVPTHLQLINIIIIIIIIIIVYSVIKHLCRL